MIFLLSLLQHNSFALLAWLDSFTYPIKLTRGSCCFLAFSLCDSYRSYKFWRFSLCCHLFSSPLSIWLLVGNPAFNSCQYWINNRWDHRFMLKKFLSLLKSLISFSSFLGLFCFCTYCLIFRKTCHHDYLFTFLFYSFSHCLHHKFSEEFWC